MDMARLAAPCPTSRCPHLLDCWEATVRRAGGGHTVTIVPSPKMDTQSLVAAVCSCGRYRSGSTTEPEARKAWRSHADAKMGFHPSLSPASHPLPVDYFPG